MADTYAGNPDNWVGEVRYAQDGDAPNETGMIAPTMEDLSDRTAWLHKAHDPLTEPLRGVASTPHYNPASWEYDNTLPFGLNSILTGVAAYWPINVPHGATITQYGCILNPGGGHAAFPFVGTKMKIQLVRYPIITGAAAVLEDDEDPSGTLVAYEASHVHRAACSQVVDLDTYVYAIAVVNESGASAIAAGNRAGSPQVLFVPGQYPGGL